MRKTGEELNPDSPLEDLENDRLGYAHFAKHLAGTVVNRVPSEGYTIAIHGDWGSGKSTILNFLESQLESSDEDPIVVRFNPWWFSGQPQLIEKFFEQLGGTLGDEERFQNIRSKMASLSGKLSKVPISAMTGVPVDQAASFVSEVASEEEPSLGEIKQEIDEQLERSNQPIIVFIDDIDRLSPREISQMLQLVKSVADFPNVVYVLAFDRSVVVNALESGDSIQDGGRYLQKIVQLPLPIPDPKEGALKALFLDRLEGVRTDYVYDEDRWRTTLDNAILPILSTPRDVARLANTVEIMSAAVGREVNFIDLVGLETLRVFHRDMYDSIRSNSERFLTSPAISQKFLTGGNEETDDYSDLFEDINERDEDAVKYLLKDLFPQVESQMMSDRAVNVPNRSTMRAKNRICAPERFPIYFRLSVPEGTISEAKMGAILSSVTEPDEFINWIDELSQEELPSGELMAHEFFYRLSDRARELDPQMVEPLLLSAFRVIDDLAQECTVSNRGTFLTSCRRIVFRSLENIDRDERGTLVRDAILNGSSPYFASNLLAAIHRNHAIGDGTTSNGNRTIINRDGVDRIGSVVAEEIELAADNEELLEFPEPRFALRYWPEYGDCTNALNWVNDKFQTDEGILEFIDLVSSPIVGGNEVVWSFDPHWVEPYFDTEEIRNRLRSIDKDNLSDSKQGIYDRAQKGFEMLDSGSDPGEGINWI